MKPRRINVSVPDLERLLLDRREGPPITWQDLVDLPEPRRGDSIDTLDTRTFEAELARRLASITSRPRNDAIANCLGSDFLKETA